MVAKGLGAARGYRVLFSNLSLKVTNGECLELRGPNGSGKSTLLRILAGLTRAQTGSVEAESSDNRLNSMHFLGHLDAVKPNETAQEQAQFWARFLGAPKDAATTALEIVGLSSRRDVPGRGLSAGQKKRLALSRLVMDHRPIWLLDEPFAGLDVQGAQLLRDLAEKHRSSGGLIITAVHGQGFNNATSLDLSEFVPA